MKIFPNYDKINCVEGKSGEIPARARRRDMQNKILQYIPAAKERKVIVFSREDLQNLCILVETPKTPSLFFVLILRAPIENKKTVNNIKGKKVMKNSIRCIFSKAILLVLIAAMALTFCSCKDAVKSKNSSESVTNSSSVLTVGEGKMSFVFLVTEKDGKQTKFSVKTDEKTVGEALLKLKIISGDEGDYGLYVKTVNGISLDYEKDGLYWAFYTDGQYAPKGIELTEIKSSSVYELKAQK